MKNEEKDLQSKSSSETTVCSQLSAATENEINVISPSSAALIAAAGNTPQKEVKSKTQPKAQSIPCFVISITLLDTILMIWSLALGGFEDFILNPMIGPPFLTLQDMGAKWTPGIIMGGQWWRFVTAFHLHAGIVHFFWNMLSFVRIGYSLELIYGTLRIAPIYILSGLGSISFSTLFASNQLSVGASGAIYGFYGILLIDIIKNWKKINKPYKCLIICIIALFLSFLTGLFPGVDNFAHIGGFIIGITSAIAFLPSLHIGKYGLSIRVVQALSALILTIIIFLGVFLALYLITYGAQFCEWCQTLSCLPIWPGCKRIATAMNSD